MTLLITTESGAQYYVDQKNLTWRKNNEHFRPIKEMYCIYPEDFAKWSNREEFEHLELSVGNKLYISGAKLSDWWISTPIASIEEIEDVE